MLTGDGDETAIEGQPDRPLMREVISQLLDEWAPKGGA